MRTKRSMQNGKEQFWKYVNFSIVHLACLVLSVGISVNIEFRKETWSFRIHNCLTHVACGRVSEFSRILPAIGRHDPHCPLPLDVAVIISRLIMRPFMTSIRRSPPAYYTGPIVIQRKALSCPILNICVS